MKRVRKALPVYEVLESRQLMSATIPFGTVTAGNIAAVGQADKYTFTVPQGADIEIDTKGVVQDSAFLANFVLTKPNGGLQKQWWTNNADGQEFENLDAGTYTLAVSDHYGSSRGQYGVAVEGISPTNSNPAPLSWGGVVQGQIGQALETHEYSFSVDTLTTVRLATKGYQTDSDFLASFALFSPNGALVKSWWTNNSDSPDLFTLPAGNYMLKVNDHYLTSRGSYSIGLDRISTPFSTGIQPLSFGGVTTGHITQALESREFSFTLAAQTMVQLKTIGSAVDDGFLAQFGLYNSAGTSLGSWWTNNASVQDPVSLPAGTYMVRADDKYMSVRGDFAIGLETLSANFSPDATALKAMTPNNGAIGGALDVKQLTFTPTGSDVTFTTSGSAIDNGFLAKFSVYDGMGTLKKSWWTNAVDSVDVGGLTAGAGYVLTVSDLYSVARGNFMVSAIGIVGPVHVDPLPTTTALGESQPSITVGSQATFTATVMPATAGVAAPTGTVDFLDNGTVIGTSSLQADGTAVFSTTSLAIGSDSITARFNGDANSLGSTSSALIEQVVSGVGSPAKASNTTLVEAASSINVGDNATFTASVSSGVNGATRPTGTVDFLDNGILIGSSAVQANGNAVFSTTSLPEGTASITARYSGDSSFSASSSGVVSESVTAAPPPINTVINQSVLPTTVTAGQKMKGKISVLITNSGSKLKGNFNIEICLSTTSDLDGSEVVLQTVRKSMSLKAGAKKQISFNLKSMPAWVTEGLYNVVAKTTDPTGSIGGAVAGQKIQVNAR